MKGGEEMVDKSNALIEDKEEAIMIKMLAVSKVLTKYRPQGSRTKTSDIAFTPDEITLFYSSEELQNLNCTQDSERRDKND